MYLFQVHPGLLHVLISGAPRPITCTYIRPVMDNESQLGHGAWCINEHIFCTSLNRGHDVMIKCRRPHIVLDEYGEVHTQMIYSNNCY